MLMADLRVGPISGDRQCSAGPQDPEPAKNGASVNRVRDTALHAQGDSLMGAAGADVRSVFRVPAS